MEFGMYKGRYQGAYIGRTLHSETPFVAIRFEVFARKGIGSEPDEQITPFVAEIALMMAQGLSAEITAQELDRHGFNGSFVDPQFSKFGESTDLEFFEQTDKRTGKTYKKWRIPFSGYTAPAKDISETERRKLASEMASMFKLAGGSAPIADPGSAAQAAAAQTASDEPEDADIPF